MITENQKKPDLSYEEIQNIIKSIIMTTCQSTDSSADIAADAVIIVLKDQGILE